MSTPLRYNQNRQRHPEHGLLVALLDPDNSCFGCHFRNMGRCEKPDSDKQQLPCLGSLRSDFRSVIWVQQEPPRIRLPEALENGK